MKIIKLNQPNTDLYYCIASNDYDYATLIEILAPRIQAVNGSFAYKYSLAIISQLFKYANNLRELYSRYYSSEYNDFKSYLYQKEIIDNDLLEILYVDESHTILKLNPELNNYNISTLFDYDDNNLDLINSILKDVYI